MNNRVPLLFATGVLLAWAAPGFAQQGPDNLWEVTTTMTMEGMRMPGPPTQVCARAGQSESMMPVQGDCQVTDRKTVGDRTTFRVNCTGKDPMSGTGEMTTARDSYQGIMRLSAKMDGETTNMTTEYSGKLVGKCTAK
jgi:Protein of unknown function (DUF3617)